jgi:glutamate transport system permease protein
MTAPILADALGPRGRRQAVIGSFVAGVVIAAVAGAALNRLADKGQLDADKWRPLTDGNTIRFLLHGLENTLKAAVVAMVMAMALGALLALGRLAQTRAIAWIAGGYVELLRGTPLLLLLFFSARGLPKLHVDMPIFWYVVLALVAYNSAVLGEIFRAGILSLSRGQSEAAAAIGLTYWQGMRLVIVPQAARRMVPAIVSQLVTLLKDTSLGFVVGYEELLRRGDIAGEFGKNRLQALIVVAVMYMLVNMVLSQVARRLEVRQRRRYDAGAIHVGGVEDLALVGAQGGEDTAPRPR